MDPLPFHQERTRLGIHSSYEWEIRVDLYPSTKGVPSFSFEEEIMVGH